MLRMINKIAIALEVSEDRQHCSIVAAGRLDETIVIELAAYLDGTDPVQAVQRIHSDRKVVATVVDPHSNAATTIALLKAAGVKVTEPSSTWSSAGWGAPARQSAAVPPPTLARRWLRSWPSGAWSMRRSRSCRSCSPGTTWTPPSRSEGRFKQEASGNPIVD